MIISPRLHAIQPLPGPRFPRTGFQVRLPETGDVLRFSAIKKKGGNPNQTQLGQPFLNSFDTLTKAYGMAPPRGVLAQALTSASLMLEHYASEDETMASVLFTLRQHRPDTLSLQSVETTFGKSVSSTIEEAERFEQPNPPARLSRTAAMLLASKHLTALEHHPDRATQTHRDALDTLTPHLPPSYKELVTKLKAYANQPVPFKNSASIYADTPIQLTPSFLNGLRWATFLHKKQSRHGTGTPYVSHLFDVASQIALHGGTESAVVGGLLHDAPEDQGGLATFRLIQHQFPAEVAEVVHDLTQPDDIDDWYAEKRQYIDHIPGIKNPQSLLALTSDKYHNLKSIFHTLLLKGDGLWKSFHKGQNEQLWFYQRVLRNVQDKLAAHPIVTGTQNMLQTLKATAFNREAKPFLSALLARVPQYKDLTILTETLPATSQRVKDADGSVKMVYPSDRSALHRQIKDKLYGEFKQQLVLQPPNLQKVAHIVTGMMGSGKTSMVVDRLPNKDAVFIVDSDRVKELIPEYNLPSNDPRLTGIPGIEQLAIPAQNGLGATAIHLESSAITDDLLDEVIQNGDSFVISHTGRDMNFDIGFMKSLKTKGYKVFLHHIEIPPKVAIERALKRFHSAGRFPPPERVGSLGSLSTDNYLKLREMGLREGFIDGCSWAYNGVPDGEKPVDIERVNC